MNSHDCELSITVARPEVPFLPLVIPHLVKACDYPFTRRTLILDTAQPCPKLVSRSYCGAGLPELRDCCDRLLKAGVVDKVIEIDYSEARRAQIYNKHLGEDVRHTRDSRGGAPYAYIFSVEEAQADYVVHFDSDILLHQRPGFNWIRHGIELLQRRPEIMTVDPLMSPPNGGGTFYWPWPCQNQYDVQGFYWSKYFSSRVFLIDRRRFDSLLPLRPQYTADGELSPWEVMVVSSLMETQYMRADIGLPDAWTLHSNDHTPDFVAALPQIIKGVEAGAFPPEQAGHYELKLDAWMRRLGMDRKHAEAQCVEQVINKMLKRKVPEHGSPSDACLKLRVTGDGGGVWVFNIRYPHPVLVNNETPVTCTVTVPANYLLEIFNRELLQSVAIRHEWLQIDGDVKLFKRLKWPGLLWSRNAQDVEK